MSLTALARDIIAHLRNKGVFPPGLTEKQEEAFVTDVLDAVETLGGFDLSEYDEVDEEDDDDDFEDYDSEQAEFDDEENDDDDDENESDSTPRHDGGHWTDPNDPTA